MSHTLFNSIFTKTHLELTFLNTNILLLQNIYQSTYIDKENNSEFLEQNNNEINNFISSKLFYNIDNDIFSGHVSCKCRKSKT